MTKSDDESREILEEPFEDQTVTSTPDTKGAEQPATPPPPTDKDDDDGDPFDLAKHRLPQDYGSVASVKKVVTTVPCKKPNRHEFVRVLPGDAWRIETAIFDDKIGHESYLVDHRLRDELATEVSGVCLFTAITKQGDVFLWPVKLPSADGRTNAWNESALAAARVAENDWVRVASNMHAGCYDVHKASGDLGEPDWPDDVSFQELLRLCFRDRLITGLDHPILRSLRGEV